eukprot:Sdes_comp12221_c0_seq1m2960
MDLCYDYPHGCIKATVSHVQTRFPMGSIFCEAWGVGMLNFSTNIFGHSPHFDGIVGLGRPESLDVVMNSAPTQTPFQKLFECERIPQVFFLYFHSSWGKLFMGEPPAASHRQQLKTYHGASPYMWILVADSIHIGIWKWDTQPCEFNTGSPYLGIPHKHLLDVLESLKGQKDPVHHRYLVRCPSASLRYPDIQFFFNGDEYYLGEGIYINPTPVYAGYCQLLLTPSHRSNWILGIPW